MHYLLKIAFAKFEGGNKNFIFLYNSSFNLLSFEHGICKRKIIKLPNSREKTNPNFIKGSYTVLHVSSEESICQI